MAGTYKTWQLSTKQSSWLESTQGKRENIYSLILGRAVPLKQVSLLKCLCSSSSCESADIPLDDQ